MEPDVYRDPEGNLRGNGDHLTSFHAGHGLVDAVGSLSTALRGATWAAPEPCPGREAEATVDDPRGDTALRHFLEDPSSTDQTWHDITAVTTSLLEGPDALKVVVTMADVPEVSARTRLTVEVTIDGRYAEVDLDRSLEGDEFKPFGGAVDVEGRVDPTSDTITFLIRPHDGGVRQRGGLVWAWTSTGRGQAEVDYTAGACPVWLPQS